MTEINQSELNNTLLRIKNSLNKRYEKDAEMYISYQDALKIRHHIFEKEFEAIADIINSGIMSKPALSRVVVKNLWLINEVDAVTARQINSIISFCDFSAISNIMQEIDNNSIELIPEARLMIQKNYYLKAPVNKCLEYLDDSDSYDNEILKTCLLRVAEEEDSASGVFDLVDLYCEKYDVLNNDSLLISKIVESKSSSEQLAYKDEIIKRIKENLSDNNPMNAYRNALYRLPGWIESSVLIIQGFSRNKYQLKPACQMVRQFITKTKDKETIESALQSVINLYNNSNNLMKKDAIMRYIIVYNYYNKVTKEIISKLTANEEEFEVYDRDVDYRPAASSLSSKTAEGIYDFLERNGFSGPNWYKWFISNTFFKLSPAKRGDIIVDFILKYSNDYHANVFPKLFQTYSELTSNDSRTDAGLEALIKLFSDFRKKKIDDYDYNLIDLNSMKTVEDIEEAVIETLIRKNAKCGGKNGNFYKYLYDFRREDCKKIFDV